MDAEQTWVMDFLANVEKLGRILVAPPGIPPARLAYLQEAVKDTLHNPQLIADGEKAERIIEYLDPRGSLARTRAAVVASVTPAQKQRVLEILAEAREVARQAGRARNVIRAGLCSMLRASRSAAESGVGELLHELRLRVLRDAERAADLAIGRDAWSSRARPAPRSGSRASPRSAAAP